MLVIEPDPQMADDYVRRKWRVGLGLAAVVVPLVSVVLWIEYRVMILCTIPLIFPLIAILQAVVFRKRVPPGSGIGMTVGDAGVTVRIVRPEAVVGYRNAPADVVNVGFGHIGAVALEPTCLIFTRQTAPNRWERFIVPGPTTMIDAMGAFMGSRGVRVNRDGLGRLAAFFGSIILGLGLRVGAIGLVVGVFVNAFAGKYFYAGAMGIGAVIAMTASILLRSAFAPRGSKGPPGSRG